MRSLIAIAFIALFSAAVFGQDGSPTARYAGTWLLDASRSKGLPPYYSDIRTHSLDVKQTKTMLTVDVELTFTAGNEPFRTTFNYPLDGTENRTQIPVRTPKGPGMMPAKLSGSVAADGSLKLTIARDLQPGDSPVKGETTETWQLTDEGKSLVIHLSRDTPQGQVEYDLFFVRH